MPIIKMMKISLPLLLLIFFSSFLFAANNDLLKIGQKAPIITGKKAVGKGLLSLTKLMSEFGYKKDKNGKFIEKKGKYVWHLVKNVVVLNFFSTTCVPCMREIPTYNKLAAKYKKLPVKMIYVNIDPDVDSLEMQLFIGRKQIRVPMMLPNQKDAIKKYGAYRLPRMVIINKDRKIEHIINGFNENLETEISTIIDRLLQ